MTSTTSQYKAAIIQIATPYSFGTGFYLKKYDLIVTNEHIVRDANSVVVVGLGVEKQLVRVLFLDARLDLAFLESPKNSTMEGAELNVETVQLDDEIWALGHPYGEKFVSKSGQLTNLAYDQEGDLFWQHNAILGIGSSGGPLLDTTGKIIGINTFIVRDGANFGFSLPAATLKQSLERFVEAGRLVSSICYHCNTLVTEENIQNDRCFKCRERVVLPSSVELYVAFGIPKTIETIIESAGHEVELSRRGQNNWMIQQGSATINIAYYEKKGLITGDAYLCHLPTEKGGIESDLSAGMYQYLLEQNYQIEGLNFSVKGDDVVLSLLIYDRYFNANTGEKLFKHLFESADHYDNILVEKHGGRWRQERV